jgi:hypothetical protein
MSSFTITCPNPKCGRALNLPAAAVGRPLSCPHCRTAIGISLGADGTPTAPHALGGTWRVPRMFLVPGFAVLILGFAGAFVNGYVAADASTRPEAALEHSRRLVGDLRSFEGLTGPSRESKGKGEPTPQDLFAAVAGQAARVGEQHRADEALAAAWAPHVFTVHAVFAAVSGVAGAGGLAILRGRWYWLAILGCVASILNLNTGCCVPGAVAGIWGLLMLVRDEGRKHFGR